MPVGGVDQARGKANEDEDGNNLQRHHYVVGSSGLTDAADENDCEQHDDDESRPVEAEVPSGRVERIALQIAEPGWEVGGRNPAQAGIDAEPVEQINNMGGKSDADGHVGDGIFENQVPADDP